MSDSAPVTGPGPVTTAASHPGIDLLGRAFEAEGFCVVRGPDPLYGGDIRSFFPGPGWIDGLIGGPPCPDFSAALRTEPTGYGLEMIGEYVRVVRAMENVPRVPDIEIEGYRIQRIDLEARECGCVHGRIVTGRRTLAEESCRQRVSRKNRRDVAGISGGRTVTVQCDLPDLVASSSVTVTDRGGLTPFLVFR